MIYINISIIKTLKSIFFKSIETVLTKVTTPILLTLQALLTTASIAALFRAQDWLRADHLIPGYYLLVVPITALALPLLTIEISRLRSRQGYRSDCVDSLVWRWSWHRGEVIWQSIKAYCPRCDHELTARQMNSGSRYPIYFDCEACAFATRPFPGEDFSDIRSRVRRKIDTHLRCGTWRGSRKRVRLSRLESQYEQS